MFGRTGNGELLVNGRSWRIYVLAFFILAAAGIIFIRLYFLQVKSHEKYLRLAENQHKIWQELIPERGEIFLSDEKGEPYPLAVNKKMQMAYAAPKEIVNKKETAEK